MPQRIEQTSAILQSTRTRGVPAQAGSAQKL